MLAKSVKGCSNNKVLPITSLLAIELANNKLTLTTTDATNYLYVSADKIEGDSFYVVVVADSFSKLIAKTTSENVTLELVDDKLIVTGNGKYTFELPLDEEGQLIKFPNPMSDIIFSEAKQDIHLSTIKALLSTAKPALATDINTGCYTGYYAGDNIIATDTYKICGMDIKLFNKPVLLSSDYVDLLDVMSNESIEVQIEGDTIVMGDGNIVVYGKQLSGITDYQVDAINGLLGQGFESMCKLPKDAMLSLLDRLALFVGTYDNNGIYLTFTNKGLMITSKKSTGSELIEYQESENFKDFTCCVDIEMLRSQIKAQATNLVELWYGEDNALKMVDGNVTQIVALAEDDRQEN